MILVESNNGTYFTVQTTGMKKYDDMLHYPKYYEMTKNLSYKIVWMNPLEYVLRCARDIFDVPYSRLYDHRNDDKISKYADKMKNGTKFDMPIINYSAHTQEGLHRAIAASTLGSDVKIPVMIIFNSKPLSKFIPPVDYNQRGVKY